MIEPTLLAWCAGIVDGEGTIHLKQATYGTWIVTLQVSMTHAPTIRRFHEILKHGKIHVKLARKAHWKDELSFLAHGHSAVYCIKSIQPYLVTKAEQAKLAFEYHEKCSNNYGHGNPIPTEIQALRILICEEMHELNKRGRKEG